MPPPLPPHIDIVPPVDLTHETGRIWPPPFYLEGDPASAPGPDTDDVNEEVTDLDSNNLDANEIATQDAPPRIPPAPAPSSRVGLASPPAVPPSTSRLPSFSMASSSMAPSQRPPPAPASSAPSGMAASAPSSIAGASATRPPTSMAPPARGGATPQTFGTVAFLGTGSMGTPMAANIARKGFALHVWNRTRERAQALVTLGAKLKVSPAECASGARVVVTMLADERALLDVLTGQNGILTTLPQDSVVVDMSTIGRAGALRVAQLVRDAGGRFIDAPVTGSPTPAQAGELVALVGGKLNDITRAQPVLLAMCKRILHAGDVGQGQALKVLLNGIGIQALVAMTSMIALGEKLGLARRTLLEALASSPYASPAYNARKEKLIAKDFSPETSVEIALRDSRLNAELQQEVGLPLAVQREVLRTLEKAVEEGLGPEDVFALEKYFKL